jgi:hypothetical protein
LFEHHFLWCNHFPNAVEVISTDSKCFLSHFTLVTASDRHGGWLIFQIDLGIEFAGKVPRLQYGGLTADGNESVSPKFGRGYMPRGEK